MGEQMSSEDTTALSEFGSGTSIAREPKPRPLGSTEVARALLDQKGRGVTAHAGVKLARNASGNVTVEVSVPVGSLEGVDTLEAAQEKARELFDALTLVYPWADPKAAREGLGARASSR
jgi:hypothetical protein